MKYYIIIIIIIIGILVFFEDNIKEHFKPTIEYTIRNGYDFKDDKIFNDVYSYENDQNLEILGIDKCLKDCNGNCVEYGQTGTAFCFPFIEYGKKEFGDYPEKKNKISNIITPDNLILDLPKNIMP